MPKAQTATATKRGREVIPNAQRRETTRAAIVTAAAEAFDEYGYLATRLDDIVSRTRLTKGAVYFHFSSKEALAADLARHYFDRVETIVGEPGAGDGLTSLITVILTAADVAKTDATFRAGARLAAERELFDEELDDPYEWWVRSLSTLARRARRDGSLDASASPAAVARTLATFLLGAQQISTQAGGDLRRRIEEFWELLEPALRAA